MYQVVVHELKPDAVADAGLVVCQVLAQVVGQEEQGL